MNRLFSGLTTLTVLSHAAVAILVVWRILVKVRTMIDANPQPLQIKSRTYRP